MQGHCRETHIKRYWLPSTIKGPFWWVVCQLLRAFNRLQTIYISTSSWHRRLIYFAAFSLLPEDKESSSIDKTESVWQNWSRSDAFIYSTVQHSCGLMRAANQILRRKSHTRPPLFPSLLISAALRHIMTSRTMVKGFLWIDVVLGTALHGWGGGDGAQCTKKTDFLPKLGDICVKPTICASLLSIFFPCGGSSAARVSKLSSALSAVFFLTSWSKNKCSCSRQGKERCF